MLRVYYEPNCLYFMHKDAGSHKHKMTHISETGPQPVQRFFEWAGTRNREDLTLVADNPDMAFKEFSSHFLQMKAAGGLVINPGQQVMMIFRLGKWDLPKGKLANKESYRAAALREVEEECGISGLTIIGELPETIHVYMHTNGSWIMKKTCWYLMHAELWENPVPQKEEQILKAVWCDTDGLSSIMKEAYRSIADLLEHYLQPDKS